MNFEVDRGVEWRHRLRKLRALLRDKKTDVGPFYIQGVNMTILRFDDEKNWFLAAWEEVDFDSIPDVCLGPSLRHAVFTANLLKD